MQIILAIEVGKDGPANLETYLTKLWRMPATDRFPSDPLPL
jgi:hypothetical protein